MANPVIRSSNSSAYALFLAYALIVLSLWKVDIGLIGRTGLTVSSGNNVVATRFTPIKPPDESRIHYRLLVSMLEQSGVTPSVVGIGTDAQNKEDRRLAALALMVYATGDGIRR